MTSTLRAVNDLILSVFLGVIEGVTEFLPVSSTAHLRIAEALLQFDLHDAFWKMYTIVIQLGAILALPVYFWNRILKFLANFPRDERGDRNAFAHPVGLILIAFVVTAVPAFALKKEIGQNLENLWVMAWALLVGGMIMWVVDAICRHPRRESHGRDDRLAQAIWIGALPDAFGGFSGTSRSMCDNRGRASRPGCPAPPRWSFRFSFQCRRWRSRPVTICSRRLPHHGGDESEPGAANDERT